jgi:hypothetical protein
MLMEVFKSVTKTTLTSAMIFVSIIRLGMIAYPAAPNIQYSSEPTSSAAPVVQSQVTLPGTKRRIVMGQNAIGNLGKVK